MSHARRHNSRTFPPQPLWLRWVAGVCVALAAFIGSAQAIHIHGQWLPRNAHAVTQPALLSDGTGEDHCPLCVALHSTLPATQQRRVEPLLDVADLVLQQHSHEPEAVPHFALFSRPPPLKY